MRVSVEEWGNGRGLGRSHAFGSRGSTLLTTIRWKQREGYSGRHRDLVVARSFGGNTAPPIHGNIGKMDAH
jgi:hypothetical protein